MGTLLNNTLSLHHGNYLKFIPSVDQLAKTLYLIVAQLIAKAQFERALDHANDLYKSSSFLRHGIATTVKRWRRKLDPFVNIHLICYSKELESLRRQKYHQGNDHHTCVLC